MAYINGSQTFFSTLGTKVMKDGVYQGEWSADFAEAERQKSKNLYDATISERTQSGITVSADTGKLYINGTGTLANDRIFFKRMSLKAGSYTLCLEKESGSISSKLVLPLYVGNSWTTVGQATIWNTSTKVKVTFTIESDISDLNIAIYIHSTSNINENVVLKYQLVSGTEEDYDFQAYQGGRFVQEKNIADVEHIETIYNKSSSDSNINKGLTSGVIFDNTTELSLGENLSSKYKGVYVYVTIWNTQVRCYCDISYGQPAYAFAGADPNNASQSIVVGQININNTTGKLKGVTLKRSNLGYGEGYATLTDNKYNIYKVVGVLK